MQHYECLPDKAAELKQICRYVRKMILRTIAHAGAGHTGGSLSEVEILVALYFKLMRIDPINPLWPLRDRFILSKGHASVGLYCVLANRGFFHERTLSEFDAIDSMLQGHPCMLKTPGVDMSTGSLGQGLSAGIGMILGRNKREMNFDVYVLMGDGELQEGQVWEAAMYAGFHKLTGLIGIVDYNKVQLAGTVRETLDLEPLDKKWEAFGWQVVNCADGHDIIEVISTIGKARRLSRSGPVVVIAHTIKGKGVSFMEGKYQWHGRAPGEKELEQALAEIDSCGE
jgi:transketolase